MDQDGPQDDLRRQRLREHFRRCVRAKVEPPLELRPTNPVLPLNWRWQVAEQVACFPQLSKRHLDRWTCRAVEFFRGQPDADLGKVRDLAEVTALGEAAGNEARIQLAELEARLLAAQTKSEIAAQIGLSS